MCAFTRDGRYGEKKDPTRFPLIGDGECVKTTQDWPWTGHVVSETGRRTCSLVQAQVKQWYMLQNQTNADTISRTIKVDIHVHK